jgi:hypothetical protein
VHVGRGQAFERLSEQIDAGELVAVSRQHQHRTCDVRPVLDPQLVGMSGAMERIAEEDEPRGCGLRGDEARDPAAEGVSAYDRVCELAAHLLAQRLHRTLGRAAWQPQCRCPHAAPGERVYIRRHPSAPPEAPCPSQTLTGPLLKLPNGRRSA